MSALLNAKPTGRRLRTASQQEWKRHKPRPHMVQAAMQALEKALPPQWLQPIRAMGLGKLGAGDLPEWAACFDGKRSANDTLAPSMTAC